MFEEDGYYDLLEINHKYYILIGDTVAYYDPTVQDWSTVRVEREVSGFEPYEFFSNTQLEEDTIFEDVDLVDKKDWEKQESYEYELLCGTPFILERSIDNENYYYVFTDFRNHLRNDRDDRLLFIVNKDKSGNFEIIKAYYLAANLRCIIEPDDVSGEAASVEYSDDFPVELQEMLVYQYSGIGDESNNGWEQYKADCEIITLESSGDIPFEDIVKAADINSDFDKISMQAADIDGDGIDEYVINDSIGRGQLGCIYVVKNVDEKWTLIGGGNARYSTDVCSLLEYKDRYYLLVGAQLSCWNEEAEIPDRDYWEKWDSAPWQADVWDVLEIEDILNEDK